MKTLVNREPRVAGSIIEYWQGYDESGTIYVPDLPNFVTSVAATSLPENCIITVGNKTKTFIESLTARHGKSLFTYVSKRHPHHQGLSALEDVSPKMVLAPTNARWEEKERSWVAEENILVIQGKVEGP